MSSLKSRDPTQLPSEPRQVSSQTEPPKSTCGWCHMGHGDQCGQILRNTGILWEIFPLNVANWTWNEPNRIGLWTRCPLFLWPLWAFAAPKLVSFPQFLRKDISFSTVALRTKKTRVLRTHSPLTTGLLSFLNSPSVAKSLTCYHTNSSIISYLQYPHSCALQVWPKRLQYPSKVPAPSAATLSFPVVSCLSSQREAVPVSSSSPNLHGSSLTQLRTTFSPWHLNPSKTWFSCLSGLRTHYFSRLLLDWYTSNCGLKG